MPWDKDPDEAFPARHPREPGGLRQEILDEIADHLACAAEVEGEGQDEGNEDSAWRRALERFGDPDAVARRLWWDAMRETVMREWIQTGVMIVAAAAVVVGVVFMGVMMARVNSANETMATAMEQVAASNEALLAALSRLSSTEDGGATQELSTIAITVRRGSAEGPPAADVKVELVGRGPDETSLTVPATLDTEGRVLFERLYQGAYTLKFEDPQTGLYTSKSITLFAGKGDGDYTIVAPDVMPRPVHIDWGLPAYGRDEELLIVSVLAATWSHGDMEWQSRVGVLSGHNGTRVLRSSSRELRGSSYDPVQVFGVKEFAGNRPVSGEGPKFKWESYPPCILAGDIAVEARIEVLQLTDSGDWKGCGGVFIAGSGLHHRERRPTVDSPKLTFATDTQYTGVLPDEVLRVYGGEARYYRNRERVADEAYQNITRRVSWDWTESLISQMAIPSALGHAYAVDGQFFVAGVEEDSRYMAVGWNVENDLQQIAVVAIPDDAAISEAKNGGMWLVVNLDGVRRGHKRPEEPEISDTAPTIITRPRPVTPPSVRATRARPAPGPGVDWASDVAGNSLTAYAVRSSIDGMAWPQWNAEMPVEGVSLDIDEEPFWQAEATKLAQHVDEFSYIHVPHTLFAEGSKPPTAVLLRWKEQEGEEHWQAVFQKTMAGEKLENMFCWLALEPIAGEGAANRPLKNIEGRFHYDAELPVKNELKPVEP